MGRAIIVSGFPGMGKTYFSRRVKDYKILDSDSRYFSWIYDKDGNKTDERDPAFPHNYINYVKSHINDYDIIFVSTHKVVRDLLKEEEVKYYLIYPNGVLLYIWISRFVQRGNSENFINDQIIHWNERISDLDSETFPTKIVIHPRDKDMDDVLHRRSTPFISNDITDQFVSTVVHLVNTKKAKEINIHE